MEKQVNELPCPHGGYPGSGFPAACEQCAAVTIRVLGPSGYGLPPDTFQLVRYSEVTLETDKPMTVHYCAVPNTAECSLTYTLLAGGEVVLDHDYGRGQDMYFVRQHWDDPIDNAYRDGVELAHQHEGHTQYMVKCGWLRASLGGE